MSSIFFVEYLLHGERKSFAIRIEVMNNAEAWQWASCDAGLTPVPKPGCPPLKRFSKPMAERFGVTHVRWRESAAVVWEDDRAH